MVASRAPCSRGERFHSGNMPAVPAFAWQDAGFPPATVRPFAKSAPQEAYMLKTIMAAAAVSTLALTSAMAQTSTAPSTSTTPSATAPSSSGQSASTTNAAGKAHFVAKQTSDQWLATKFKGTDVIGTD